MSDAPPAELAVVIVNYNTGPYLERCLASLRARRGDVVTEVLVIDNASHDGSHTAAVAGHPEVRLIENPVNVYLSPAWNQGARETAAPYLLFLNPDAEIFAGTLADYVRVAADHRRAGIVGPMIRNPDGTVYASGRRFPGVVDATFHAMISPFTRNNPFTRRYEMDGWDRTTEREVDWVSGACMLMPRGRSTPWAVSTRRSRCMRRSSTSPRVCGTPDAPCCSPPRWSSCTRSASPRAVPAGWP